MAKIVVYHGMYGCDTGCCGHYVEMDNDSSFEFAHPYGYADGDHLEFAKQMVRDHFGEEHVADLDWDNCLIVDD